MPNGVMIGSGTSAEPYIVMDGYDFNALRNISTSSTNFANVELGADIVLDMFNNFTQIPTCYMNIDGKGFSISEFYISNSDSASLFGVIYTEYIKDLVVDGEVSSINTDSGFTGSHAALFAKVIVGCNGAQIRNVKCFGAVTGRIVAGFAVSLNGNLNDSEVIVSRCAFKGKLVCTPLSSAYTSIGSLTTRIGGLFGTVQNYSGAISDGCSTRVNFIINECIVIATMDVTNNGSQIYIGGITATQYWGNSGYTTVISKCTAKIELLLKGSTTASNPIRYGGLIGYSIPYQNDTQLNSLTCIRCAFHTAIKLGTDNLNAIIGGFANNAPSGMIGRTSFTEVYSVMEYDNQGNSNDTEVHIDGISRTSGYLLTKCFWDSQMLEASYTKYANNYVYPGRGVTSAQMKGKSFLASQGWSI